MIYRDTDRDIQDNYDLDRYQEIIEEKKYLLSNLLSKAIFENTYQGERTEESIKTISYSIQDRIDEIDSELYSSRRYLNIIAKEH